MTHQHNTGSARRGLTLVEMLVVIAIIGILAGLLLPAVQMARESARRTSCSNQLKQLALAIQQYESANSTLPPGGLSLLDDYKGSWPNGTCNALGNQSVNEAMGLAPWTVLILPFMDDTARYDTYDLSLSGTFVAQSNSDFGAAPSNNGNVRNRNAQFKPNPKYTCASDPNNFGGKPNCNYLGVTGSVVGTNYGCSSTAFNRYNFYNGIFALNRYLKLGAVTDGTSMVFLLGETRYFPGWVEKSCSFPGNWFSWDSAAVKFGNPSFPVLMAGTLRSINSSTANAGSCTAAAGLVPVLSNTFGSFHPGGCGFAMVDGSVRFVGDDVDITTYQRTGIRNDGGPLESLQ